MAAVGLPDIGRALKHAPRYYPLLLCAFRTGLRFGDLLGLQWNDVDERGRFIEVRRKEQMGHSSIKITVDTYGHLVPGSNRAAVDRLDTTGRNPRATGTEMHAKEAGANGGCPSCEIGKTVFRTHG